MAITMGFSVETVARLTGLQENRIRYWARTGVQTPSLVYEPGAPYGYLYSFQDLVSLRTLKNLRDEHGFSLQSLRCIGSRLRKCYEQPWSTLTFFAYQDHLAFSDSELQQLISATNFGQSMFRSVTVDLSAVSREMEMAAKSLRKREPKEVGQISRVRLVYQSKPVIAGTRIPVSLIQRYANEGYSKAEILRTYPFLEPGDIDAALAWDQDQRAAAS